MSGHYDPRFPFGFYSMSGPSSTNMQPFQFNGPYAASQPATSPSGPPELALHGSQASPTEDEPARKSKYDKWSHIEQQCLLRLWADQMTDVREQMACHVRLKFTLTNWLMCTLAPCRSTVGR